MTPDIEEKYSIIYKIYIITDLYHEKYFASLNDFMEHFSPSVKKRMDFVWKVFPPRVSKKSHLY